MELPEINYWAAALHFVLTAFAAVCLFTAIRLMRKMKKKDVQRRSGTKD